MPVRAYRFGLFRLHLRRRRLTHDGRRVALTPKAFDTLRVLIERRGQTVGREELLAAVWPDAFVEEAVLTQNVYTLRKALGELDPGGSHVETVPRRGYRFVAEVEEERSSPARASSSGKLPPIVATALTAAALLLLAVTVGLLVRTLRPVAPEAPTPPASLAVLPFEPLADSDDARALGLGMADALIQRLSELEGTTVRPTSSVRTFLGDDRDSAAIGRRLGVQGVVDGTIQRQGERVRATVQLVSTDDGVTLWAQRFEAAFTDIFAVQDSIAAQVAGALELELAGRGAADPVSTPAYEAYITGRYLWNERNGPALIQAATAFERAIALEPGYARAHAGLADTYVLLPLYGDLRPHEAFPRAIEAAATALALDPGLAEAQTTLAYSRFLYEWSWQSAEEGFRRALELNPGYATAHHWYAYLLAARGRHDEAIAEIERARELDPLSRIIRADAGLVLYFAGRPEAAIEVFDETLADGDDFAYAHFGLGMALEAVGRSEEAVAAARRAAELTDGGSAMLGNLGRTLAAAGYDDEARRILARLLERGETEYVQAGHVAMVYTGLGEVEPALDWWRRALEERSRFVPFFAVWPVFEPLRGTPGFEELERRVGVPGAGAPAQVSR